MIYLDTHVVVWLYEGLLKNISGNAIQLIEENELLISPIIKLELTYLYESKKITRTSQVIVQHLEKSIGLKTCDFDFDAIVNKAQSLTWTRDPFDRLITAQAFAKHAKLITKDKVILKHFKLAFW